MVKHRTANKAAPRQRTRPAKRRKVTRKRAGRRTTRGPSKLERAFQAKFDAVGEQVALMGGRVGSLDARMASAESTISGMPQGFSAQADYLRSELGDRMSGFEENLQSSVADSSARASEIERRVAALTESVSKGTGSLHQRIAEVDERAASEFSRVDQRVGAAGDGLEAMAERVAAVEGATGLLKGGMESSKSELAATIASANRRLDGLEERLRTEIDKLAENTRSMEDTVHAESESAGRRITTFEARIDSMSALAAETTKKLEEQIASVRSELKDALRSVLRATT